MLGSTYETAFRSNVKGHRLQLIPFFLYLLQQVVLGFKQSELHTLSHTSCAKVTTVVFLLLV